MTTENDTDDGVVQALLAQVDEGDPAAFNQLVEAVYPELKRLAHDQLAKERRDHTLNTTAIVHEAYERLAVRDGPWQDHAHFMRTAARIMRHLLVDYARRHKAGKRGAGDPLLTYEEDQVEGGAGQMAVLKLEEALTDLAELEPRIVRVVECRIYAGLTPLETADALDVPLRTVERDWQRARGYVNRALTDG
jgi:RNA polymerase sigma factor (TIGR02999 family)